MNEVLSFVAAATQQLQASGWFVDRVALDGNAIALSASRGGETIVCVTSAREIAMARSIAELAGQRVEAAFMKAPA